MEYKQAKEIADFIKSLLEPHCIKIEIAGSVRRKKSEVKDIEIVAIPKPYDTGLFASGIAKILEQWPKIKGELGPECRYTKRMMPQGIVLDLFFCTPENWGIIYLIRTGDWEFSKKFVGAVLPRYGYKCDGGFLMQNGTKVFTPDEEDIFNRCGLKFIQPELRNNNSL